MTRLPEIPLAAFSGMRSVLVAVFDREGALVDANAGFRRLAPPSPEGAAPARALDAPPLDELLARLDAAPPTDGWRLLHEGPVRLGAPGGETVEAHGSAHGHEGRILLVLEAAERVALTPMSMLRLCAQCRRVRGEDGRWERLEEHVRRRTGVVYSHGICERCLDQALLQGER